MTQPTRKLAAIVFTDVVGFTELTSRDEAAAMSLLKWQRETFKPLVIELGGEWLKEVGDGLLLSFPSSQDAVRCAIGIQEAAREVPNLKLRVGIHQGDIIQEGPDILGDGVNIASRIQQVAPRGGIAISDKVQQDISGYPEFEVISLGQHSLKGVARSMEIYCLSPFGLPEIPEYRLLRLTGQGAYGEVWLAQSLTGVHRAVKIVHRDQFEDDRPYEREFTGITGYEPVSRKHEGLIDLLHVGHGEDDSFFYYVMELADDQRAREEINPREYRPRTLQSELEARGKLSIGECLDVGSRLARGLAFLHDHNLLHRDVKPANIVYVDGHPKLADIGLITTMDNASTLVGTMGYIPPEGPGKSSSDIYALGMVLYELSTGKDRADFPEIDVLDPELKGLNQACLKACSNDLSERFANAHAFADELDRLARGKSTPDFVSSSPQSSNLKMGALAAALIAILALVLYQQSGDSNGENGEKPEPAIGSPSGSTAKLETAASAKKPGTLLWEFVTGGKVESSPAIGADGTVYVGSRDNKVYALDGQTGAKKWEFITNGNVRSSPAIGADGTVYVGSYDNKVYALEGKTGAKKWEFETGGRVTASPAIGADGTLYVGSRDNKVYALNGATGAKQWEFETGALVHSSPAIGPDGTLYVGSDDNKVYALEGNDGTMKWKFQTGHWVKSTPAIGAGNTIYVGSYGKKVYALDGNDGTMKWNFPTGLLVSSSPAIGADGTVYVGSGGYTEGKVYALDGKSGAKRWEFVMGRAGSCSPAIGADGTLYIGSSDGKIYALDGVTGAKRWEYETGALVGLAEGQSSPAIGADGTLYVGSGDKKVYALKTDSKGPAKSPWPMYGQNAQHTGRAHSFLNQGLVAYYPFNGNAKDESGNGNDGELIGANLAADRHGEQKRAMEFNAPEAHIRIRDKPELDLGSGNNQEKTILFWMHHSENPAGGFLAKMSGKTSLTRDYAVGWGPGNGIVWGTGSSREAGSSTVDDELSVPCRSANNLWSHIAVSYSYQSSGKSFKKVYFNGKLLHSGPRGSGKLPANQADLIMGRGWRGKMDDVRIYNRALEDDEVALVYSTEKPRQPQGPTQLPLRLPATPSPNLFMPLGLVAYYPFDGNSRDESKEGNHLDVYGATLSSDRFGKAKSAYRFDGKDDFAVAYDSDSLDMGPKAEGWAVSCWINPQQGEEEGSYYIINKSWHTGSPGVDYGLMQISGPTGQSYLLGISTASRDPGGWAAAPVPEGISHKGWRHIVATVDTSQKVKRVYVNGRRIASINYQHKNPANNHALRVGSGNGRHYWKGDLDDIRIYNRALSEEQVTALYDFEKPKAAGKDSLKKGLLAYYPFNGNANDASGNDHNGTVNGATPATDRYGNPNSAYNFDGVDDFIEAPSTAGMNHSDVKTVALWYAPNNTGTGQGQWCVGKYRADTFDGGWGLIVGTDNRLHYNYKRSHIIGGLHTGSTNPMGLGVSEWVHLAATVNGNTVTLFKDGQVIKVNTIIADRNPRDNTHPLLIGAGLNPKARSSFINGKLDDIRIYNRALPAAEVAELYELEKPTRERERPTLKPYEVDRNTVLLEHFEGATTGKSNRPVSFDKGRIGQGLRLTPKTFLSWDKGPLVEGTYEFWFKLDEEKYLGTLASANFKGLPTAITILIRSEEKGNVYSELFTQGPDWSRPKYIENKMRVKQWNHAAVSWGRKGINTYLNGVRIGFLEGTHLLNRSTGTWALGAQIRTADRDGFAGVIDEVRISKVQREFKPEDFTP